MADERRLQEVRQSIEVVLSCCLQNDSVIQRKAMERKLALEVVEEYPLILCDIIASGEAIPERHLASVFLKNFLEDIFEKNRAHSPLHVNGMGRKLCIALLRMLEINNHLIKQQISLSMAYLAAYSSEFWDYLSPYLMNMVLSDNTNYVENAVYALQQIFRRDLMSRSNNNIGHRREFFDGLMNVFKNQRILARTRANTLKPMLNMVRFPSSFPEEDPFSEDCLYKFGEEFETVLGEPYSVHCDFSLKSQILQFLCKVVETSDNLVVCVIPGVLPAIGRLLMMCCDKYKSVIKEEPLETFFNETPQDFFDLINYAVEFVKALLKMQYFDILIEDIETFLYCMYIFMACIDQEMELEAFRDCVDRCNNFFIRDSCADIVKESLRQIIIRRKNGCVLYWKALGTVFEKLNGEIQHGPSMYSARISESMMYGLGLCHHWHVRVVDAVTPYKFPVIHYIQYWTNMLPGSSQIVKGRLLWVASKYSYELSHETLHVHMKLLLDNFNTSDTYLRRPSAMALKCHLKRLNMNSDANKYMILSFSREILSFLLSYVHRPASFLSCAVLNALGHFIKHNQDMAIQNMHSIEQLVVHYLEMPAIDYKVVEKNRFIIATIAEHGLFKNSMQSRVLSYAFDVIHRDRPNDNEIKDRALDLLYTYVLFSSGPLDDEFVLQAFAGAVMQISRLSQEDDAPQYIEDTAGHLLVALVTKCNEQLKRLEDERGIPLLQSYPQLIEMLLRPDLATLPGQVLGRLIIVSLYFLPQLMAPHCMSILRSLVTIKTTLLGQKCLIFETFCFVCMLSPAETVDFLSFLPGPYGGSAMNYILGLWCPTLAECIHKSERQILVMSIIGILQYCLANQNAYTKVKDCSVLVKLYRMDLENRHEEYMNGIEFLYFCLMGLLFYELKQNERVLPEPEQKYNTPPPDVMDAYFRIQDDTNLLFRNHVFNVNIVERIALFLKTGNKDYFDLVYKFTKASDVLKLRNLGCAMPPIELHEDME